MSAEVVYNRVKPATDEFKSSIGWRPFQTGAVFAINGQVVGMELFDSSHTMANAMSKLVESYALDAVDVPEVIEAAPEKEIVKAFLAPVAGAKEQLFPAVGLGEDVRLSTAQVAGGALRLGERVVHLSAFQLGKVGEGRGRGLRGMWSDSPGHRARVD